jgi:hypothetical protein
MSPSTLRGPGQAVYLGNLWLVRHDRRFDILVRDHHEDELPLFMKHYPNLRSDQVELELMRHWGGR